MKGYWLTIFTGVLGFMVLMPAGLLAQEVRTEPLWPAGAPDALGTEEKDVPKLIIYPAEPSLAKETGIVISRAVAMAGWPWGTKATTLPAG